MDLRGGRERSPRRGHMGQGTIPLVDLLVQQGVLDDKSADYLKKAPIHLASEVLLSLGPEVRNPSAFVTNRLKPYLGSAPPLPSTYGVAPPSYSRQPGGKGDAYSGNGAGFGGDYGGKSYGGKGGGYGSSAPPLEAPRRTPRPNIKGQTTFEVHHNGNAITIEWVTQEQAVLELVSHGILDEGSADFLMQATEDVAKEVVSCLQPDVRNPSAFVTRKLKEMRVTGRDAGHAPGSAGETINVHFNGATIPLQWSSKEQAVSELLGHGVLDEGSADFLMKASEALAKDIVSSLGPDVRNPSAFVTRRCKETDVLGVSSHGGYSGRSAVPTLPVFHQGITHTIQWPTREVALKELKMHSILDEKSADFLSKLSEDAAWDIVSRLGPDVRNPSAFVTKEAKKFASY